jgi:hypothetical protein
MLVDSLWLKNVAYIMVDKWDERNSALYRQPAGTAFFVSEIAGSGRPFYVVTARHVIECIRDDSECLDVFIRVNEYRGTSTDFPIQYEDWIFHPSTDVAVRKFPFSTKFDFWSIANVRGPRHGVFPGHDVFFIGMFNAVPGQIRVEPVVRFGKIALPSTTVPIKIGQNDYNVPACLVESRSWGGESGSPVFVYDDAQVKPNSDLGSAQVDSSSFIDIQSNRHFAGMIEPELLGLLHGHFEIERPVMYNRQETGTQVDVNTGIAVVIPALAIYETLMDQRLVTDRELMRAKATEKN